VKRSGEAIGNSQASRADPEMPDIVIDARGLRPPEPLERASDALDMLDQGELTLILDRRPYPLFGLLSLNGYRWKESELEGGGFKFRIQRR
jgi:TusA-related sulfurtransferase